MYLTEERGHRKWCNENRVLQHDVVHGLLVSYPLHFAVHHTTNLDVITHSVTRNAGIE